ncbi:hypothetical protein GCM10009557_39380 [Virgisporangium ochraceum]|uniref:SRPBCC family protein n=1 Tax=Virgisporangium ochraceum TaxID=65505 RepID=A0A8J3ZTS0_9ACTN|nr:SRPBCC family protein [Virgisporangium ochraceum]GIJ68928.1 hypothetical protein Voc01_038450 [Virgisporangium ochraceum]
MILNVHERTLPSAAGALIDTLSGSDDRLWPHDRWPAQRFDRPLGVGAVGGHGPVRYDVRDYEPGRRVRFGFRGPAGFHGYHEYEALAAPDGGCLLRHSLVLEPRGRARLTWPLIYRPLHDALIEDSLATAARNLGVAGDRPQWSVWVRLLRFLAGRRA